MTHFNWLSWLNPKITEANVHMVSAALVLAVIAAIAIAITRGARKRAASGDSLVPSGRVSLSNIMEVTVEFVLSLIEDIIGPTARRYLPLLGSLFIYILFSNLLGVIPGFAPPTNNINTNLAMSLTVFLYYNVVGIKTQGLKNYLAHMTGPILWLAPLIFVIELISHIVRPMSLSLRLFGNINGDHVVLGIFSELVPLVLPVIFMALGVFVALIQAFVFTLLSTIYIGLATAHEEHH